MRGAGDEGERCGERWVTKHNEERWLTKRYEERWECLVGRWICDLGRHR